MARISKRLVDAATPNEKDFFIWDDSLKGFGLKVHPTGVKSFVYQYRTAEGRSRRATIAKVGTLTPDAARQKAEEWARLVKDGGDPLEVKKAAKEALTVEQVLDRYLLSAKFADKAESTKKIDRGRIERHLKPLLGSIVADKLTPEGVRKAMRDIETGKTAKQVKTVKRGLARVRGGPVTARDCIGLLRSALNWAVENSLIARNAAASIKLKASNVRSTILNGPEDYKALFSAMQKMEAEKRLRGPAADAIRVIALTGARRDEIRALRWRYVDLRARQITLPPVKHKTGHKSGRPRVIHLPTMAADIIARQPPGEPDDFVFRPAFGDGPLNLNKPWREIREEAGLPEELGLHGLRHSMASALAMGGAQASEIQAALGHATIAMSVKYVHWADKARAALAEKAAAPALAGLAAIEGGEGAEVVLLKGGKK